MADPRSPRTGRPLPPPPAEQLYKENGRWYQQWPRDKYLFPSDKLEQDRLDIYHRLIRLVMNEQLHTPYSRIGEGSRVLDIGCGTGIWIMQKARETHSMQTQCLLVGVDTVMAQPEQIPANVRFFPADIEAPWTEDIRQCGPYDVVICRLMRGAITSWRTLFSHIAGNLKPGTGVLEHIEFDWTFQNDHGPVSPMLQRWSDELSRAMDDNGTPIRPKPHAVRAMLDATGFTEIREEAIKVPISNWAEDPHAMDMGRWFNLALSKSIFPMALAPLTRVHRRSKQYVEELAQDVQKEILSHQCTNGVYMTLYIWTAKTRRSS